MYVRVSRITQKGRERTFLCFLARRDSMVLCPSTHTLRIRTPNSISLPMLKCISQIFKF